MHFPFLLSLLLKDDNMFLPLWQALDISYCIKQQIIHNTHFIFDLWNEKKNLTNGLLFAVCHTNADIIRHESAKGVNAIFYWLNN